MPQSEDLSFDIPASKSIYNRALIAQSYFLHLSIDGKSTADDVLELASALWKLGQTSTFHIGLGGTSFRFLVFRVSRQIGNYKIFAAQKLLARPQAEIKKVLNQLGVQIDFGPDYVEINSKGWIQPDSPIKISQKESTQFSSALLMNCWDLEFEIELDLEDIGLSEPYWRLSLEIAKNLGMSVIENGRFLKIAPKQRVLVPKLAVESDMSSAAAMAALAALKKTTKITRIPKFSSQADFSFINIMQKMNVKISNLENECILVEKSAQLKPVETSLQNCPDLFPVLSVLATMASGQSRFDSAPQLVFKESNRIEKISELLNLMKIKNEKLADGIIIFGNPNQEFQNFKYDAEGDHRLVMAAVMAKVIGHKIEIVNSAQVSKSFPEFLLWSEGYL